MLHSSYYPAKLVWLRETQRELYDRVARWASPSEYLYGCWFGPDARRVSVSMASGTGLFNQQQNRWDEETLRVLDIPVEKLAPIVNLTERAQGLAGGVGGALACTARRAVFSCGGRWRMRQCRQRLHHAAALRHQSRHVGGHPRPVDGRGPARDLRRASENHGSRAPTGDPVRSLALSGGQHAPAAGRGFQRRRHGLRLADCAPCNCPPPRNWNSNSPPWNPASTA